MGAPAELTAREYVRIIQARGAGYAISRADELDTIAATSLATGVTLDPVYGGKALHGLLADMRTQPERYPPGCRVLLLHTGGLLGAFDKLSELQAALSRAAPRREQRFSIDSNNS